jgi:nitrogen fixation NifU-like protein
MDLKELYRDVILDHNRQPRNFGALAHPDAHAEGHNPLCGDRLTVWLRFDGERIADIRFEGTGCAISTASASVSNVTIGATGPKISLPRISAFGSTPVSTVAG